jgi:hypothetical protein
LKILVVDSYYPAFLEGALQNLNAEALSYSQMLNGLLQLRFGTADFYSRNLRNLGHDASDIIFNCAPLQRKWAAERGVKFADALGPLREFATRLSAFRAWLAQDLPLPEIAERQVREAQPDVLYLQDLTLFRPDTLRSLRSCVGLIVGQIACPLPPLSYLREIDLVLTSFPHYVDRLQNMGKSAEYFRIGFDPIVLDLIGTLPRTRTCTFVGGISLSHRGRKEFLEKLAQVVEIEFFGYGVETLPATSPIRAKHHGEVWGLDMYRRLAESRITVNVHIDVAENYANNMRLYEATGCGALLVTDEKQNLHQLFSLGSEVITYRTVDEAIDRIAYFNRNPSEAASIARAGQSRTLLEHTYRQRMEELIALLQPRLPRRTAWA